MLKAVSRSSIQLLVAVLGSASLYACGAPPAEEGSAPELGSDAQPLTSYLSCTRNSLTHEVTCTNSVSDGTAPFTYFWQTTEEYDTGDIYVSGWYTASSTERFQCPRSPTRGNELNWYLKIEVYAVDANGAISPVVYRGFPCSIST